MRWVLLLWVVGTIAVNPEQDQDGEVEARNFMEYLNRQTAQWANQVSKAEWDYESNLNNETLQFKVGWGKTL